MKIATYNVEFLFNEGTHSHSGKEWTYTPEFVAARIENLAKIFSEIDADVLLLQEVASEDILKRIIAKIDIMRETSLNYQYFIAVPDQNGVGNAVLYKDNTAICTSIPARTDMPVFIEGDVDTIGSRVWSRRDFVKLETQYDGKKLHIIGLHIKSNFLMALRKNPDWDEIKMTTQTDFGDSLIRSEMFRFSQARKVRQCIDEMFAADSSAQVVVAGDFNATERNSLYRIVKGVVEDAADSLIEAGKEMPEDQRFSIVRGQRKSLIDHMFISKSLELLLTSTNIHNQNISAHKNIPPTPTFVESDHAPIVIEFK